MNERWPQTTWTGSNLLVTFIHKNNDMYFIFTTRYSNKTAIERRRHKPNNKQGLYTLNMRRINKNKNKNVKETLKTKQSAEGRTPTRKGRLGV